MKLTFRSIVVLVVALFSLSNASRAEDSPTVSAEKAASAALSAQRYAEAAGRSAKVSVDAAASAASSATTDQWAAPEKLLLYAVPCVVFAGALIAAFCLIKASPPNTWSLADALSEEVPLTPSKKTTTTKGTGGAGDVIVEEPQQDKDGNPVLLPEMRASASRVIALMGMVSMLFIYLGFAVFALFSFGSTGQLPKSLENAVSFLVAGMTLFAPYAVNKFASLFKGISGGK